MLLADFTYLSIPGCYRKTAILHHHRLHLSFLAKQCQLRRGDVADADHLGLSGFIELFHRPPHLPIRCPEPPARKWRVQDIGIDIVRPQMLQRAIERLLYLRSEVGTGIVRSTMVLTIGRSKLCLEKQCFARYT